MAWKGWAAGSLPLESCGFPMPPWAHLIAVFPCLSRKLRLALPCIGLDGLGAGLQEVQWGQVHISYAYDIDESLRAPLAALHGDAVADGFQLGRPNGDILTVDVTDWERVDLVVSGPPCPPWSAIGLRGSKQDVREVVFQQVTNIVVDQAQKGCFGFILEMVPGIDQKGSAGEQTYLATWLAQLRVRAPMLRVFCWLLNTADYLPHHRRRLYIVGVNWPLVRGSPVPPRVPYCAAASRATLEGVLHRGLSPLDEGWLPPPLRLNLAAWKQRLRREPGTLEVVATISVDRDPSMSFGPLVRTDGLVGALRSHNELNWIYIVDNRGVATVSRCMHPVERLTLQGFRPELADFMSKSTLLRATGNAFSAPVAAAVMREFVVLLSCSRLLGLPGVLAVLRPRWLSKEEEETHLRKRRRLNIERSKLAILERRVALLTFRSLACGQPGRTCANHATIV